jgi:hypothetical protein
MDERDVAVKPVQSLQKTSISIQIDLGPELSTGASITIENSLRWSTFSPQTPVALINIHTDKDVATTVWHLH